MLRVVGVLAILIAGACTPEDQAALQAESDATALESTDQFQVGLDELGDRDALPGAALYGASCASCHDGTVARAPHFSWLEMMPARTLMAAMNGGIMAVQAVDLDTSQREHIVEYLTRARYVSSDGDDLVGLYCSADRAEFDTARPAAPVGWGHDTRRFVPGDVAGLSAQDVPGAKISEDSA